MRAAGRDGKKKDNEKQKKVHKSEREKRRNSNALWREALAPRVAVQVVGGFGLLD